MKQFLSIALACLLFACASLPALANGYGLAGGIYDIVSDDGRYDDYVARADDGNKKVFGRHVNHAILENRYHTVLIAAWRDGQVWKAENVSTTAVYQPGDKRGEAPNTPDLRHEGEGFLLTYGDEEEYLFIHNGKEYGLWHARYKAGENLYSSFTGASEGLLFFQTGQDGGFAPIGDALWHCGDITLANFNIAQTPRSIQEIARANRVRHALDLRADPLAVTSLWEGAQQGRKLPVYSAPDASSYRSAKGKASVSMAGDVEMLGSRDGWTLIQYEVSPRTSRIGWIEGDFSEIGLSFAEVPLTTAADTFLTDDPFVSQYAQTYLAAGTQVTGLARCGEYYAYVECVQGRTTYRGFVPMKDLDTAYDLAMNRAEEHPMSAVRWDVMASLVGKWVPEEGSNFTRMILFEGGFRRTILPEFGYDETEQNFRVYGDGVDGQYEIVFYFEDNSEFHYTLQLCKDGAITLSDGEEVTRFTRHEYSTYGNG